MKSGKLNYRKLYKDMSKLQPFNKKSGQEKLHSNVIEWYTDYKGVKSESYR